MRCDCAMFVRTYVHTVCPHADMVRLTVCVPHEQQLIAALSPLTQCYVLTIIIQCV